MARLLMVLLLAGCAATPGQLATGAVAVTIGSIPVMQRSPLDAAYSVLSGKDCSVVRLDQGKSYCRPVEPPPQPPSYCSRSLGVADCWQDPASLPDHPRSLGDGPATLTPEQEADRTRRWPNL